MTQAPPIDGRLPGRVPPHDLEAEQSVLGAMLLDELAIIKVSEFLRPPDFYRKNHEDIYRAALELLSQGEPIDIVTVGAELEKMGVLERVGGRSYLAQLEQAVPTAANIEYYGRIVKEKATKRSLISAGGDIAGLGYDDAVDAPDALNMAQKVVFDISEDRLQTDFEKLFGLLRTTMERVDALQNNVSGTVGVASGFYDLDAKTNGFKDNELIIVAGRPSMGKTSLALNIALEAAVKEKVGVAIFSLEMSKDQLAERLLCEYARVDAQRLHRGLLGEAEHERLAQALGPLGEAPIFIDDSPMLDELMLLTKARRIKLQEQVGMVIVDYLQLMHSRRGSGDDNRVQEVSQISRSMKALARELKVPVMALSQLSRGPESRTDKRPMLSDLRESGCLTGDSRVYLPETGGYRTMRELAGRSGFKALALNPSTWKLEERRVERAFSTGVRPVLRLTTALGRTVRATANHKFLAFEGWRRIDELSAGDYLALPRTLPAGAVRTMTDAELGLLGHLIGDGCTLPRHAIQYMTREPDLAAMVAALAGRVFGEAVTPRVQAERDWYQVYLPATAKVIGGIRNPISAWLEELGVFGLRSHEKRVPDRVFEQPVQAIAVFLRHLWSTDGCIHAGSSRRPQPTIYYATSSRRLAGGVQSLLLRLGINARVRRTPQSRGRDQWQVFVSGRTDMLTFLAEVGTVDGRRAEAAALIEAYFSARVENTNRDVVPSGVWRSLAVPAALDAGLTSRTLQAALGNAYLGTGLYKQNLSRERAGRVAVVVGSTELGFLAGGDVYWDRIVSVEPDGEAETFDLTVEGLHNFVADDYIVHNSIEQDADVVIFLYREGYYNKADTTGIAEVIVAKNRNGPTGTVNLRFRPELTRFENLDLRRRTPDDGGSASSDP